MSVAVQRPLVFSYYDFLQHYNCQVVISRPVVALSPCILNFTEREAASH